MSNLRQLFIRLNILKCLKERLIDIFSVIFNIENKLNSFYVNFLK